MAYPAQTLYRNATLDPGLLNEITTGTNGACELALGRRLQLQRTECGLRQTADLRRRPRLRRAHRCGERQGDRVLEPRLAFRTLPPSPARRGGSFAVEAVVEASGQAVAVASTTPAVCSVVAGEVTLLAAGPCTLAAAQPGYLEAQQSFAVARTLQQVGFSSATPVDAVEGGPAYQPVASASSGLPVALVSLTPAVCAIQGKEVAPQAAGVCTIAAEQGGDAEYEPAPPATQSYSVAAVVPAGGPPSGGAPAAGGPAGGSVVAARNRYALHRASGPAPARDSVGVAARRSDHPLADRLTEWNAGVADDLHSRGTVSRALLLLFSRVRTLRRGTQAERRRHLHAHRAPKPGGAEALLARPPLPARAGAPHADDDIRHRSAHRRDDSREDRVRSERLTHPSGRHPAKRLRLPGRVDLELLCAGGGESGRECGCDFGRS